MSGWGKHHHLLSCFSCLGSGRVPPTCLFGSPQPPSDATKDPGSLEGLEGQGIGLGAQQAPCAQVGGANALHSSCRTHPACLSWSLWPTSYAPRTHVAWMGLWKGGNQLRRSVGSPALVGQAITLCSSPVLPGESLPLAYPDLPGLRGTDPFWPPLLHPLQSPYVLLVHSGVPPISLGVRVLHQQPAGGLVVGRC